MDTAAGGAGSGDPDGGGDNGPRRRLRLRAGERRTSLTPRDVQARVRTSAHPGARAGGSAGAVSSTDNAARSELSPSARMHAYLGTVQLAASASPEQHQLVDGEELMLPIVVLPGVVLFPGETLPLRLHRDIDLAVITLAERSLAQQPQPDQELPRNGSSSDRSAGLFGVVCGPHNPGPEGFQVHAAFSVGTVAAVASGARAGDEQVVVLARGMRRFRITRLLGFRQVMNDRQITPCA
eukprot:TRINITY_DN7238_c0_g1_i1.p1 TRINITY_DN7238_c0_g1~~TRINITY_DN7238_c0_g1_i1.p1  ORF type:complete len:238 (+),score=46.55 TRINITY_DN7238_c0_g1_i1:228-941(+)